MLHKTWQPKKINKKYNKDYIGLSGLLQTNRDNPILANKDKGLRTERLLWNYGQTKYSRVLFFTIYYLELHRPTIKRHSKQIWLVDELQKTAVDCNRGLYIQLHSEYD